MILRWDLVTIGHLSRNRYWGEPDDRAVRPPLCTCTLVRGQGPDGPWNLLVDPSLKDPAEMARELDRRTGLKLADIQAVFITHAHGDHHFGLGHFSQARWLAAPPVAAALQASGQYAKAVEAVAGRLFDAIEVFATPGHTLDHHSLRFVCEGLRVVIAGDAAMTRDFFRDRRGYFNSADPEAVARSIDALAASVDLIVPGHDNYFPVLRRA